MLIADAGAAAGAAAGVEAGIASDLADAAAAGDAGKVHVDLMALREYYFKVLGVYNDFKKSVLDLPADPYESACIASSPITGVANSMQASMDNALGTDNSMHTGLAFVASMLGSHLQALADTYNAYIKIDTEGAADLSAAGNAGAGKVEYTNGQADTNLALDAVRTAISII